MSLWVICLIGAVVAAILLVIGNVLVLPWIRLQQHRRASALHMPQPDEIWTQRWPDNRGSDLLYIHAVDDSGLTIWAWTTGATAPQRWRESWAQWSLRLSTNTVLYTGRREPLGDA